MNSSDLISVLINVMAIVFVYLTINIAWFAFCVYSSKKLRRYQIQQKYSAQQFLNNLSVIIYAHNDEQTVVPLLEMLNKQNYPKSNYQVNIILDNCTDDSSNILEFVGGAKIWRVGEDAPLGKDEAVSWLLEGLVSFQNTNAFVFLDSQRMVDEKFLTSVNAALSDADVLVGSTELVVNNEKNFLKFVRATFNNYHNRIFKVGRRFIFGGLTCVIDSNITIIKQEVIEKVKCIDFTSPDSELKYTTLLTRNKIICKYAPCVKTFVDIDKYEEKKVSLKMKVSLFWHCLPLMFTSGWKFVEHIFNLLRPGFWTLISMLVFVYAVLGFLSLNEYGIVKSVELADGVVKTTEYNFVPYVTFLVIVLLFSFISSLFISGIGRKKLIYLISYPFYSLIKNAPNIKGLNSVLPKIHHGKSVKVLEKFSVDVVVSGGKKLFKCKLEMIAEDNLVKAVFLFKRKKYTSSFYVRTCDAVSEIVDKLEEHGFRLQICQTCGYFSQKVDGALNIVKGHCHRTIDSESSSLDAAECFLWNSCEYYIPKEINNVIDISTYM